MTSALYPAASYDIIKEIYEYDGNFYVFGSFYRNSDNTFGVWSLKYNSAGEVLDIDTVNDLNLYYVNQIEDKFLIFGYKSGLVNLRKVSISADFDINNRQVSLSELPINSSLNKIQDGSFVLVEWDSGLSDYVVLKFDNTGKSQFTGPIGSIISSSQIIFGSSNDGGLMMSGRDNIDIKSIFVGKMDVSGSLVYWKRLENMSDQIQSINGVTEQSNGDIIILGQHQVISSGSSNVSTEIFVLKRGPL